MEEFVGRRETGRRALATPHPDLTSQVNHGKDSVASLGWHPQTTSHVVVCCLCVVCLFYVCFIFVLCLFAGSLL